MFAASKLPSYSVLSSSQLLKLRLKLLLDILILFTIGVSLILLLLLIENKYKISGFLNKKINIVMFGHTSVFPAMNDTLLISGAIILILTITSVISYQLYYKHCYERNKLDDKENKFIGKKRFLVFLGFSVFHSLFDFIYEELSVSFETSISGLNFFHKYVWLIYGIVFGMMFIDHLIEIVDINLLNDKLLLVSKDFQEKKAESKDSCKTRTIKFVVIAFLALISVAMSLVLNLLPNRVMRALQFSIDGQNIILFSNDGNIFLLSLAAIVLIPVAYKFFFPAIEELKFDKNYPTTLNQRITKGFSMFKKEMVSVNGAKTVGIALTTAFAINVSICATNSLQSMNLSSPAILIPLFQLFVASVLLVYLKIWQFCQEERKSTEVQPSDLLTANTINLTNNKTTLVIN